MGCATGVGANGGAIAERTSRPWGTAPATDPGRWAGQEGRPRAATRMSRKRVLALGAAVTGVGLIVTACDASGQGGRETGAANTETEPVAWLTYGNTARLAAFEKVRDAFPTVVPGRSVDMIVVPGGEYWAKLKAAVSAGTPPDVGFGSPVEVPGLVANGLYQPLDPFISRDRGFKLDDYQAAAVEAGRWKGKLYFLPLFLNFHMLAYNAPLLRQHGVALPAAQWTWELLQEAAVKLTVRSGAQTDVFGFNFSTDLNSLLAWIWSHGGEVFDRNEDPTKSTMTNPRTMQALQFLVDLRQKVRVAPNEADRAGRTVSFQTGTIAMDLIGVSALSTLVEQAHFEWDVQIMPRGAAGRVNFGGMGQFGIVAGAKRPQGAWAFLKVLHGPQGNREMIKAQQGMTPFKPLFGEYLRLPPPPANRQAVVDAVATIRPLPKAVAVEANYPAYTQAFREMLEGRKSVQETCVELDRLLDAALARR